MALDSLFDAGLVAAIPRFVTPVLLVSLGGALCQLGGVVNIALEGQLLVAAFAAVCGSYMTGSALWGVVLAMLVGASYSCLLAYLHVKRRGDAIVSAIALNLLALGGTAFLLRVLFHRQGVLDDPRIVGIKAISIDALQDVPLIGSLLSSQSPLFMVAVALCVGLHFFLQHHRLGLRLRGAGENPEALGSLGVNPFLMRSLALLACGVLCGLAGAQLSLSNVTLFVENMSAGRGWIAVVLVMLTRGQPLQLLGYAVLFGAIDQVGIRAQGIGWPQQLSDSLPYVTTLTVLAVVSWKRQSIGNPLH